MSEELDRPDEELRRAFFDLRGARDIANLLEVRYDRLVYHIYEKDDPYTQFEIPKKNGEPRVIRAPVSALKLIQKKLNQVLQAVYDPKPSVQCAKGRSIITNAEKHAGKSYLLHLDLARFFPSINFGRVRGMFMAVPYERPADAATVLAQIACHDNELPQGAPTSTTVANMLCAKFDSEMQRLAKRARSTYTRYVDDITFSTTLTRFPESLAQLDYSGALPELEELSEELVSIVEENGFEINEEKVRLQIESQRQEVTGLIVNEFPNVPRSFVRQIRAMLHAWRKFGLEAAEEEHNQEYRQLGHRDPDRPDPSFQSVLKGKIEFLGAVKGKDDPVYLNYRDQYDELVQSESQTTATEGDG